MASSTAFSGVKITWLGHASVMLEGDGLTFYIDPFVLPKGAKPADAILYSHGHFDHCVAAPSITKPSTVLLGHGCKLPCKLIEIGQKEKIGSVVVEAVHAYNINKPFHPKGSGAGFILRFKGASAYFAGDTDFIPEMKGYKCDIALLPIGGTYTMNELEAAEAAAAIMPKLAIPIHYNYLKELSADPEKFKVAVEEKTGGKVDVRILSPLV
ncbi:MAG: MBL fold metallo-hydrolase [Candidatus Micrarchaeota archaeon]|nr:MBL fold metallo-hydrolase [Candidatus Micrarchaeota archaeon]